MLGKLIKYDLRFGRNAFLGMAVIIVLIGILGKWANGLQMYETPVILGVVLAAMLIVIISVLLVCQNFNKNLYSDYGYLTLTLPVKRNALIISKLISSLIWFNMMTAIGLIVITLVQLDPAAWAEQGLGMFGIAKVSLTNILNFLFLKFLPIIIEVNIIAASLILSMFMIFTISNVSIMGKRVGSVIGGISVFAFLSLGVFTRNGLNKIVINRVFCFMHDSSVKFFSVYDVANFKDAYFYFDYVIFLCFGVFGGLAYIINVYLIENYIDLQ